MFISEENACRTEICQHPLKSPSDVFTQEQWTCNGSFVGKILFIGWIADKRQFHLEQERNSRKILYLEF